METSPQPQPTHAQRDGDAKLRFLVEHHGVIYLTEAIAGYDANAKGITAEQVSGVSEVRRMLDEAGTKLCAAPITRSFDFEGSRTHQVSGDPPPDR